MDKSPRHIMRLVDTILILCAAAHVVAASMMALLSDIPSAYLPPCLVRNTMGIQFIETNWYFPLTYLLLFLGTLIYMEIRATPRWTVWVSFMLMSLPAIAYLALCLHLGTSSFVIMYPNHP